MHASKMEERGGGGGVVGLLLEQERALDVAVG